MRASRSWPRSSVPNGCCHEGPSRRAVKSISLIGTFHRNGPSTMAAMIANKIARLATARRWRRNRLQASRRGEKRRSRLCTVALTSAVGDTWVEPAIEDIGDQVEEDDETGEHERHRHDEGRVVCEDRADQERADAGNAKDLLGDDGATE